MFTVVVGSRPGPPGGGRLKLAAAMHFWKFVRVIFSVCHRPGLKDFCFLCWLFLSLSLSLMLWWLVLNCHSEGVWRMMWWWWSRGCDHRHRLTCEEAEVWTFGCNVNETFKWRVWEGEGEGGVFPFVLFWVFCSCYVEWKKLPVVCLCFFSCLWSISKWRHLRLGKPRLKILIKLVNTSETQLW